MGVQVNTFHKFAIGSDVPSDSMDLKWVLAHELGHALGLHHGFAPIQSPSKPMMYLGLNKGDERRSLKTDCQQGISVLYDTWEPLTGSAKDVGIGWYTNELTFVTTQHIWHVGEEQALHRATGPSGCPWGPTSTVTWRSCGHSGPFIRTSSAAVPLRPPTVA